MKIMTNMAKSATNILKCNSKPSPIQAELQGNFIFT